MKPCTPPWHSIETGKDAPAFVKSIIEIPKGSKGKYEMDKDTGLLRLDRVLFSSVHYPANYGFIPQTYGDDHDPPDILLSCGISQITNRFRIHFFPYYTRPFFKQFDFIITLLPNSCNIKGNINIRLNRIFETKS